MEFSEWITKKYIVWRGNAIGQDRSITEFGAWLKVSQSLMSQWMKKDGKIPESAKHINNLVEKFGIEVYGILGLDTPNLLDTIIRSFPRMTLDIRERLAAAISEYNDRTEDIPEGDPRLEDILKDSLKQNGFKP
jgi:hypothetical protein